MRCEQVQGPLEYCSLSGPAYVRRENSPLHARGLQHLLSSSLFMLLLFHLHGSSNSNNSRNNSTDISRNR
jgi:hypothetical protein